MRLDHMNLSDCKALFVVGMVAHALSHPLTNVSVSPSDPLLLHWDAKLLPDIAGGQHKVDRVDVLVSGGGEEKLLAVPAIGRGTGEEQANACLSTLDDWQLRAQVRGRVFDTSSNTGLNMGACTLIEQALGTDLVWIACRQHVFESCFLMFSLLHSEPVQRRMSLCSSVSRNNGHLLTEKSSHLPAMISSSLMTCDDCVMNCSCTMMMQ